MINFETDFVRGNNINDVYRDVLWLAVKNGYDYIVKGGSYVGQIRKQLDFLSFVIDHPEERPLTPIMPMGVPAVTSEDKIEKYFLTKLMSGELEENEEYTYGEFIVQQLDEVIRKLNKSVGDTNQACITIGDLEKCITTNDPPCLRLIDFKVVEGKLNMTVFFRSWDLFAGLPENLGGLQMLKEYVQSHLEFSCDLGKTIGYSSGGHIYEQYFEIVDTMNIDKIKISEKVLDERK